VALEGHLSAVTICLSLEQNPTIIGQRIWPCRGRWSHRLVQLTKTSQAIVREWHCISENECQIPRGLQQHLTLSGQKLALFSVSKKSFSNDHPSKPAPVALLPDMTQKQVLPSLEPNPTIISQEKQNLYSVCRKVCLDSYWPGKWPCPAGRTWQILRSLKQHYKTIGCLQASSLQPSLVKTPSCGPASQLGVWQILRSLKQHLTLIGQKQNPYSLFIQRSNTTANNHSQSPFLSFISSLTKAKGQSSCARLTK
jgi:hypothetical protein